MAKGTQHKISEYKPPRVQITYDLEAEGGTIEQELPFVIGVLGNYSGHLYDKPKKLKTQKFLEINKANLNSVVESVQPKLKIKIPNKIKNDDSSLMLELSFSSMEDFNPGKLATNVEVLRNLMETRQKLIELQTNVDCNEKLEETLMQFLNKPEILKKLASAETKQEA